MTLLPSEQEELTIFKAVKPVWTAYQQLQGRYRGQGLTDIGSTNLCSRWYFIIETLSKKEILCDS